MAWVDPRNGGSDIYAQRVNSDGETVWAQDGVAICTAAGSQDSVQTVTDGSGGAIVVWYDSRGADADYWAQRVNGDGEILWPTGSPSTDGVPLVVVAGRQEHLVVVSDGAGGAIVAWRQDSAITDGIYAQRVSSTGSVTWAPQDGIMVCDTHSGDEGNLQALSDGAGGAYLVWMDVRNAAVTGLDLYAQRLSGSGGELWASGGVVVSAAPDRQQSFDAVSHGAGGVIVSWNDFRDPTFTDIYAQRLSSLGVPDGPADGLEVCTAFSSQFASSIVSDGAGGAIVAWYDYRDSAVSGSDVYAQNAFADGRIFADGFESGHVSNWSSSVP